MQKVNSFAIPVSRRDFMKMAGMAVGALAVGGAGGRGEAAEASPTGGTVEYAGRELPVLFDVDVCVCGGGPAGTAAAMALACGGETRKVDVSALRQRLRSSGACI